MKTSKYIIWSIILLGLFIVTFFQFQNVNVILGIMLMLIQLVDIFSKYIITGRKFVKEKALFNQIMPSSLKELIFYLLLVLIYYCIIVLPFVDLSFKLNIFYGLIIVVSNVIQFLILRNKTAPIYLIEKDNLVVNDLFLRTYNLETLQSITFDGFTERYYIKFHNNRKAIIKQSDFIQEELNQFIGALIRRCSSSVYLSGNLQEEFSSVVNKRIL